jgi:glycosyltransferase involved in cell wall biosynthesis
MKISLCIPQYNRIEYLLKNLQYIEKQSYSNLEVVISDDCSKDDTEIKIKQLIKTGYKYPIVYSKNENNLGYDRNFRRSVELATGEYVVVLGNDDSLNPEYDINQLVNFLKENNYPEVGFANFIEEANNNILVERAKVTCILGTGVENALNFYSCFSFVGGLVYKKSYFLQHNTNKHDGSIYAQIYLGCLMVSRGATLFSIKEPLVVKDLVIASEHRNSYKDVIAKRWADFKIETGGLPSVINVLITVLEDTDNLSKAIVYKIFKRIYTKTFPFWIIDYRSNNAYPAAIGLIVGLYPFKNSNFSKLDFFGRVKVTGIYFFYSFIGLIIPIFIFTRMKKMIYNKIKNEKSFNRWS